jgi:DNA-directed RNA polymerase specialized sigma24 family protein
MPTFIETCLNLLFLSERDRTIFWLHYRQGLTATQIAAIPTLNLTVKGVESTLWRLKELVKHRMSPEVAKHLNR